MDSRLESNQSGQGLLELIEHSSSGVSVRLWNAIRTAEAKKKLPYRTVEAYLAAGELGRTKMLALENLGRKSLAELEQLIAEASEHRELAVARNAGTQQSGLHDSEAATPSQAAGLTPNSRQELLALPLDAFLRKQRSVSARLLNAVSASVRAGTCPFENIADYLRYGTRQDELKRIESLGRGSAQEFERLVIRALKNGASSSIQATCNDSGYTDVGTLMGEICSLLTSRQQAVINERFVEKKTLQEVASTRDVTRERIRQIEAKSLTVVSTHCSAALRESARIICQRLSESALFELTLEEFSNFVTCDAREATLYLSFLSELEMERSPLSLIQSNVLVTGRYVPRAQWKDALDAELRTQPLPLTLANVLASITSVPGFYIREYFHSKWGMDAEDAGQAVQKYGASRMCVDVLRKAGRPLHMSDVRARICALFHVDIEEHAINATLGRLREAVIAAPGTYALYECLPFTDAQIQEIREAAHEHLTKRGLFLSSKVLFDQVFAQCSTAYAQDLNHYLVMGIVQDDERFTTKRGNMIGLATFDLNEAYTPLQDEIRRLVLENGPITLQEIAEQLSDTRRLCNDSGIRLVLNQSQDIIRIGRQTFDALHRFFDSRDSYDDLLMAVRISLLERKKTTYAIAQDLERLTLPKLTSHLVDSVLMSMDDVDSSNGFHELRCLTDELARYNSAVAESLQSQSPIDSVRSTIGATIPPDRLTKLISLDARLLADMGASCAPTERTELNSILREFSF